MKIQDFFRKWTSTRPNLKPTFHDAGIEAMAFAEAYAKQLALTGVGCQREQLIAFCEWKEYNGKWQTHEEQVKNFLKEQSN